MQDNDRAKAIADSVENAGGGSAAVADNSSATSASAAGNAHQRLFDCNISLWAGVGLDPTKQKARVNKRASVMLRAIGQPTADRSFMPP